MSARSSSSQSVLCGRQTLIDGAASSLPSSRWLPLVLHAASNHLSLSCHLSCGKLRPYLSTLSHPTALTVIIDLYTHPPSFPHIHPHFHPTSIAVYLNRSDALSVSPCENKLPPRIVTLHLIIDQTGQRYKYSNYNYLKDKLSR